MEYISGYEKGNAVIFKKITKMLSEGYVVEIDCKIEELIEELKNANLHGTARNSIKPYDTLPGRWRIYPAGCELPQNMNGRYDTETLQKMADAKQTALLKSNGSRRIQRYKK